MSTKLCKLSVAAIASAALSSAALAVDDYWTGAGADTNFSTPANWSGGAVPDGGIQFLADAGGKTVTFDSSYSVAWAWTADNLANAAIWEAADPAYGFSTTYNIGIADASGQNGALTINSGKYTAGGSLKVGVGNGVLTMNGGEIDVTGEFILADADNANAVMTISNATVQVASWVCIGRSGANRSAVCTVNDGGIILHTKDSYTDGLFCIGNLGGDNSHNELIVNDGGSVRTYADVRVGEQGSAILTMNGGEFVAKTASGGERYIIMNSASTAYDTTINLNGGVIEAGRITTGGSGTGKATFNFNGGTLRAINDGNILIANQPDLTVYVNGSDSVIDTNGKNITIANTLNGSGTLDIVGGGSVTFTVAPTCTVLSSDGTSFALPADSNFYWTGNGDGVNWSDSSNWSKGAVPGADDAVVFNSAATVTLVDTTVKGITLNADVTFNGDKTLSLKADGISGTGTLTLAGVSLRSATTTSVSVDLVLADGSTNKFIVGVDGANLTISGKVSSQQEGTSRLEITQGTGRNNANAGVKLTGDWSDFAGSIVYYQSWGSSSGVRTYQQRAMDTFTKSATSENARWDVYATTYDIDLSRANGHFFAESGTAEAPAVYKFGSLKMRLPSTKNDNGYSSNVLLEVGNLDEDSFLLYSWKAANNCGVKWIAPTATFGSYAANTAYIDIVGGGNVAFSASGVPAAINFSENGGYIVLTDDSTLNASIVAAISTVDLGEDGVVGFYYDGETELSLDLSGKAALLAGKKIAKKGAGTVCLAGLSGSDIVVSEGTLVLPHGAVVGDVTVAQGASLEVDLNGAVDNEVVFKYDSISGEGNVDDRNTATIGQVEKDDTAKTWTYKVTGSARTFTWNGSDGASWNDAANWLIDGEATTDIPSAIDTVQFNESATISASGTLVGDVQIADGVTLTIPVGLTFSKLTAESGATIAFSFDPIATVGGTLALITVNQAYGVTDALDLPPNYGVSVDAGTGAITATRNAATYTWTGAEDSNWATSGNWNVGGSAVAEVPAAEDSVVFPTSNAEGFEGWAVTLPWDVYADTVTLNANVTLSGARTLKAHTINGNAELKLNNAHIGSNGAALDVYCPLNNMANTTNYIYLQKYGKAAGEAYIVNLRGPLYGSGVLKADHAGVQGVGVKFYGDNKDFWGTFTSSNYNQRDCTDMGSSISSSSNAVWNVNTYKDSRGTFIVKKNQWFYFGALNGGLLFDGDHSDAKCVAKIEVGARDDVESTFGLAAWSNDNNGYDVRKVGSNRMTITGVGNAGGYNTFKLHDLYIAGGTASIPSLPSNVITFEGNGGYLQVGYNTVVVEDSPAVYGDNNEILSEAVTHEEYPLFDPSAKIVNSDGPIGFDDGGTNATWATAIAESNKGGFTKAGSGTLTLAEVPLYTGVTTVWGGNLVVPADTELTVNPLSTGIISYPEGVEGDPIANFSYAPGTVLDGTETADDNLDKQLNVANIAKVDLSNPTPEILEALTTDRVFVLAKTSVDSHLAITGYTKETIELVMPGDDFDWAAAGVEKPDWWDDMVWTVRVIGGNKLAVARAVYPLTIFVR